MPLDGAGNSLHRVTSRRLATRKLPRHSTSGGTNLLVTNLR